MSILVTNLFVGNGYDECSFGSLVRVFVYGCEDGRKCLEPCGR